MNIESNFWDINKEYKVVYPKEFVENKDSSIIMWCIYLYVDPRAVTAMEFSDEIRLAHILNRFYKEFDPSKYENEIEIYKRQIPEPETVYFGLLKQAIELEQFYSDIKPVISKEKKTMSISLDNADRKISGLMKAIALLEKLKVKRKELQESRSVAEGKGLSGYTPSMVEAGL